MGQVLCYNMCLYVFVYSLNIEGIYFFKYNAFCEFKKSLKVKLTENWKENGFFVSPLIKDDMEVLILDVTVIEIIQNVNGACRCNLSQNVDNKYLFYLRTERFTYGELELN